MDADRLAPPGSQQGPPPEPTTLHDPPASAGGSVGAALRSLGEGLGRREPETGTWRLSLTVLAVWGLLLLALLYTLYFAADFFKPVFAAVLLNMVLSPVVRGLRRLGIPAPVGAALLAGLLCGAVALGAAGLARPANDWLNQAPYMMSNVRAKLAVLMAPVEDVKRATEQVEEAINSDEGAAGDQSVKVEMKQPSVFERLFGTLRQIGLQLGVCLILLFFLLASNQLFKEKLVRVMPSLKDKRKALELTHQVERQVARYLLTITVINAALGLVIGGAMFALGMPNPALWGVMAALLNFIPYLGALVGVAIVGTVALVSLDIPSYALLVPLVYAGVNFLEAYFVTPVVLGHRLALNAIVIFVAVAFWGWLWGVAGALMAVPLLVTVKAVCDRIDSLKPVSEFISAR